MMSIKHKISFALLLVITGVSTVSAQNRSRKIKGWEITYKPQIEILVPDTTQQGQQKKKLLKYEMQDRLKAGKVKLVLDVTPKYVRLLTKNKREAVYLMNKITNSGYVQYDDGPFRYQPMKLLEDQPSFSDKFIMTKEYKKILGYRCRKAVLKRKDNDFKQLNIWFTKKLPQAYWPDMALLKKIPGCVLQIDAVGKKMKVGAIAREIKRSKWPLNHFLPDQKKPSSAKKSPRKPMDPNYAGGSAFHFGFARITEKDTDSTYEQTGSASNNSTVTESVGPRGQRTKSFYIDTTGKVAFNQIIKGSFLSKKQQTEPVEAYKGTSTQLPTQYVLVKKGNQYGVLNVDGQWMLKPEYDAIDTRLSRYWVVDKAGKESLFTVAGFLLPFQFEKVWMMNDNYFNVVQNGKWGVYNRKTNSLSVPAIYDAMDYCFGCETGGDYCFAQNDGKWGVIDFHNKVLLPFEYDHKHWNMRSDEWVTSFYKNGHQLVINLKTGAEKVCRLESETETDSTEVAQGFVRVRKGDKYGLLNREGKQILPCQYDYIRYDAVRPGDYYLPAPYVQINKNSQWGIADTTGHILIPPVYTTGISLELNHFFICEKKKDSGYGYVLLDKTGKRVLASDYTKIEVAYTYNDSIPYFKLEQDDRYGFYNPATKKVVQPKYDRISDFLFNIQKKNTIQVSLDGNESLVDINTGTTIVPPLYSKIYSQDSLDKALFIVEQDGKVGVYSSLKKKLVVPLKYDNLYFTGEKNLLQVKENRKYGLITAANKTIIPSKYFAIRALKKGFYLLTQQDSTYYNTFSFYDTQKQSIKKAPDSTVAIYNERLAIIKDAGKAKLWNPVRNKIITGTYAQNGFPEKINYFDNGLAVAYKSGKAGVIDTLGSVVIPFKYEGLTNFHKGYALVLTGKETSQEKPSFKQSSRYFLSGFKHYGFIDSTGTVVVPPEYDLQWNSSLDQYFKDNLLVLYKGDIWNKTAEMGLANRKGKTIISPKYDHIILQKNGPDYLVKKNKKFGIVNARGQVILLAEFDNIALQERPVLETKYKFSFPVLAEKNGVWQYYKKDGKALSGFKIKNMIPFEKGIY